MALVIEIGRCQNARHFMPDIGDGLRRARIGRGGEETDEAQFPRQRPVRLEQLDPDIVEMRPPVHARLHIGFGDDERMRLTQKLHHLRRHRDQFGAAPQNLHIRIAQQAKARSADRVEARRAFGEAVVAQAQKNEIIRREPFEKLHRLRDLIDGQRRRIGLEGADRRLNARPHRPPVPHTDADIGVDAGETRLKAPHDLRIGDAVDLDVDEALARRSGRRGGTLFGDLSDLTGSIPHSGENGMRDKPQAEIMRLQFRQRRIQQERHVVVDGFKDRQAAQPVLRRVKKPDLVMALSLCAGKLLVGTPRKLRERGRAERLDILCGGASEKGLDKPGRGLPDGQGGLFKQLTGWSVIHGVTPHIPSA